MLHFKSDRDNAIKLYRGRSWISKTTFLVLMFMFIVLSLLFVQFVSNSCPAHPVWSFFGKQSCVNFDEKLLKDITQVQNLEWKAPSDGNITVLHLFTTFKSGMEGRKAYRNMFNNWKKLSPNFQTVFFYESNASAETAVEFAWKVLPVSDISCGRPVMKSLFEEMFERDDSLFYGFANADILFNDGLVKSLNAISESNMFKHGPILIVGRRQDIFISKDGDPFIDSTFKVEKLGIKARMSHAMAADFFITNKLFLWKHVPNLVIGGTIIDNWLIWYGRATGTKIIDVTATVMALHQRELGFTPLQEMCNDMIARMGSLFPDPPIWTGSIECAGYVTQFTSEGEVFITPKIDLPYYCKDESLLF